MFTSTAIRMPAPLLELLSCQYILKPSKTLELHMLSGVNQVSVRAITLAQHESTIEFSCPHFVMTLLMLINMTETFSCFEPHLLPVAERYKPLKRGSEGVITAGMARSAGFSRTKLLTGSYM